MPFRFFGGKERELNLIPEEEQKSRVFKIKIATLLTSVVLVFSELVLFSFLLVAEKSEDGVRDRLEKQKAAKEQELQAYSALASQTKIIKSGISIHDTFELTHPPMDLLIHKILKVTPGGINLNSLTLSTQKRASLEGFSKDPAVIYQFFNVLQGQTSQFDSVDLTKVDKASKESYNFLITVQIK
ncbi:MAG: PilN domain-containing protein [Candidatus Woykebacteria bacterium]